MKSTKLIDEIETKRLIEKIDRLCKLYHCTPIDLIIMSIDYNASNNNKNIKEV